MYEQWSYIASDTHAIKVIASCKIANGSEICWKTFKRINGPECQCRRICLRITSVRLDASQEWLVIFSVKFSCHRHIFGAYHVTLALTLAHTHTHIHTYTHQHTLTHTHTWACWQIKRMRRRILKFRIQNLSILIPVEHIIFSVASKNWIKFDLLFHTISRIHTSTKSLEIRDNLIYWEWMERG